MVEHPRNGHRRLRTHRVTPGLFMLRYVASNAGNGTTRVAAPTIRVTPQNAADVELIAWPGVVPNELVGPGDGLVLRALRDATVVLEVIPSRADGSVDAELHLEPVSRLAHGGFGRTDGIEILAHVSRRGDVVIPAGEWICGPEYPMAIEGIEIRWPHRPPGLEIMTRVSVSRNGLRDLPTTLTGEFAGTRGRAAPITSVELSISGDRARDFALRLDALFLGSAVQSKRGRSISLIGPTGREPLVGLRLSIESVPTDDAARAVSAPLIQERPKSGSNWNSGGRIRVFRGLKRGGSHPQISQGNAHKTS